MASKFTELAIDCADKPDIHLLAPLAEGTLTT
jgi:hypothetical protein